MIDTTDYGDGAVRLWCDKCGRRLGEGESLLLTEDRWHDPIDGIDHKTALCQECAREEAGA